MELESTETSPDTRYRIRNTLGTWIDYSWPSPPPGLSINEGLHPCPPLTDAGCVTRSFAKAVYDQNGLRHEEAVTNLKCQTCLCMNKRYPVAPVAVPDTHHTSPGSSNLSQPCQNRAKKSVSVHRIMAVRDFANIRDNYYCLASCAYNVTHMIKDPLSTLLAYCVLR